MEIRCLVCDDYSMIINQVKGILAEISKKSDINIWCDCYTDSRKLIDELPEYFDVILLDIDMPDMDGFTTVEQLDIKHKGKYNLIFMTGHDELVFNAIKYQPFRYVRKENLMEELFEAMESVIKKCKLEKNQKYIMLKTGREVKKILINDILYIVLNGKKLNIHLVNNCIEEIRTGIKAFYNYLDEKKFIWISSGCIVNIHNVDGIEENFVVIDGVTRLEISRSQKATVKKALLNYWGNII